MSDLDEAAIKAAIDAGVRAALATLREPDDVIQVADEYPDWDEFGDHSPTTVKPEGGASPLRARLTRGVVDTDPVIVTEDDAGIGDVVPIGAAASAMGAGYQPTDDWLTAQWNRMPAAYRNPRGPAAWAQEAWSELVEG